MTRRSTTRTRRWRTSAPRPPAQPPAGSAADLGPFCVRPRRARPARPAPYPGSSATSRRGLPPRRRFFGARHGSSPPDADARGRCSADQVRWPTRARRARRRMRAGPRSGGCARAAARGRAWARGRPATKELRRARGRSSPYGHEGARRASSRGQARVLFRLAAGVVPARATARALTGRPTAAPLSFELRGAAAGAAAAADAAAAAPRDAGRRAAAALAAVVGGVATDAGSKADADACAALFGEDDDLS